MVDYGSGGQGGIAWQGKLGVNYKPGAGEPGLGYEYPGARLSLRLPITQSWPCTMHF